MRDLQHSCTKIHRHCLTTWIHSLKYCWLKIYPSLLFHLTPLKKKTFKSLIYVKYGNEPNTAEAPSQNPILLVTKVTYKTTSVHCKTIIISCDATKWISKKKLGFTNRIWKQSISMLLSKRRYLKHMAQGSKSKWISVNLRPADFIQ